jgi:hypothetical protein
MALQLADSEIDCNELLHLNLWIKGLIFQSSRKVRMAEELFKESISARLNFYFAYHSLITLMQRQKRYKDI